MSVVFMESWDSYAQQTGINNGEAAATKRWQCRYPYDKVIQTGRFGGNCLVVPHNGGIENVYYQLPTALTSAFTFGMAVWCDNIGNNTAWLETGDYSNFSGTIEVGYNSSGQITLNADDRGGTNLANSASGLVVASTWYYLEVSMTFGTSGTIDVYLNGTNVISYSGDTSGFQTLQYLACPEPDTGTNAYDDIYLIDSATPLGPQAITTIRPSSDISGGAWTSNTALAQYTAIDEQACDGDSTYITSNTDGDEQFVGLPSVLGTVTVSAVAIISQANSESSSSVMDVQISDGTNTQSQSLTITASDYQYNNNIFLTNPAGGSWSVSDVNSLEIGVEHVS